MDDVTVAISIMAHPDRSAGAEDIARRCGRLPVRIAYDPDPTGPPQTIRTARVAWRPWHPGATHHLVLQDDVALHPDFDQHVSSAIAARPGSVLSFFSEWGSFTSHALRIAAYGGFPWVRQPDTYLGTQAIAMPVARAAELADLLGSVDADTPDDHAVHAFARSAGLDHVVSNPNLVQHDLGVSLIGNGELGARHATVYVPDRPPAPGWWTGPALLDLARVPSVFWRSGSPSSYERPSTAGDQWTLAPARATFGALQDEVDAMVRRQLVTPDLPRWDTDLESAIVGVATTLCDQLAVARAARGSVGALVLDAYGRDAVRTLAPGALRKAVATDAGTDWDDVARRLQRVADHAIRELIPAMELDRVARENLVAGDLSAPLRAVTDRA